MFMVAAAAMLRVLWLCNINYIRALGAVVLTDCHCDEAARAAA